MLAIVCLAIPALAVAALATQTLAIPSDPPPAEVPRPPETPDAPKAPAAPESADKDRPISDAEAARALVAAITPTVEAIRGLTFKQQVAVEMSDDAAARGHFEDRMRKEWPDSRSDNEQEMYVDLGMLPARTGLKASLLKALEEQAAGYYDPGRRAFFVLGDMPKAFGPFIVAHELTHALDDQYFDIDGMLDKTGGDDGRAGGVAAVVEGSGTLVMTIYIVQEVGAGRLKPEVMREYQESEVGKAEKLKATPQVVKRALLAPYVLGLNFLLKGNLTGMPRVSAPKGDLERAFNDPPVSWEQVLHPEKYWTAEARDLPRPVAVRDLSATLGDGWSLSAEGGVGEMILAILTDPRAEEFDPISFPHPHTWTNEAVTGWGGDRWQLYRRGGDTVTVLATVWDTEKDARQFRAALPRPLRRTAVRQRDAVVVVAGEAGDRGRALAREALRACQVAFTRYVE